MKIFVIGGRAKCGKSTFGEYLREELKDVIKDPFFIDQMKDVIEYRAMDYYQRRYREQ